MSRDRGAERSVYARCALRFEGIDNRTTTMKMKKLALATIFAFMTVSMAPPAVSVATAQGQGQPSPVLSIPISVANFVGTFNLNRFVNVGGVLNAVGTLTGTLTTPAGPVAIARTLSIPLMEPPTATCE